MKLLQLALLLGAAFLVTAPVQAANRVPCPMPASLKMPVPDPDKPGEWIFKVSTTSKDPDTGKDITYKFEGSYKLRGGEEPALRRPGNPTTYGSYIVLPCQYTMKVNNVPEGTLKMLTTVKGYKKCDVTPLAFSCEK